MSEKNYHKIEREGSVKKVLYKTTFNICFNDEIAIKFYSLAPDRK